MTSAQREQQLILLSAGTARRRHESSERARKLMADIDWRALAGSMYRRRLLAPLGPRIVELGGSSDEFREAVEQAVEAGRRHGAFLQLVTLRAMSMLADAGIPSSALKGPMMGEAIYGDIGRRPSNDIDLLVASEQLHDAVTVVRRLGYGAPSDYVDESGLPLLHFVMEHEQRQLPPIEIHWRVHWYERRFARERLLPRTPDAASAWRPDAVDELASLLLFYARDGFVDLRLASDLSAWWDARGAEVGEGSLAALIERYPDLTRPIEVALAVAQKLIGLPDGLLGNRARLGLRERLSAKLANPHRESSRAQIYADIGLIDGLLAPPGGFGAFVRRNVLPPREILDQQARHGARSKARSRLGRSAGVVGRYAFAMTRLLRSREPAH